jgi:RNA 3'-terminal phosphate cyclase (ATP)
MLTIDGSLGEGGGQVLRTSLSLSMLTGKPFRMVKIRAGRGKPGLLRQHLTSVHAAAKTCGAKLGGAGLGSQDLEFWPGNIRAGDYHFAVGTAGSTMLVLQTLLPALMLAHGPSTLVLEGGTHNPHAPPVDFLSRAFLPVIHCMGPRVDVTLERYGFYPKGGGRVCVSIEPATRLEPFELTERGPITRRLCEATVVGLPEEIARRELNTIAAGLDWPSEAFRSRRIDDGNGPGNFVTIQIECQRIMGADLEVRRQWREYLRYMNDQIRASEAERASGNEPMPTKTLYPALRSNQRPPPGGPGAAGWQPMAYNDFGSRRDNRPGRRPGIAAKPHGTRLATG